MSLIKKSYLKCDGCGCELAVSASAMLGRIEASKAGWSYIPSQGRSVGQKIAARDLCASCTQA